MYTARQPQKNNLFKSKRARHDGLPPRFYEVEVVAGVSSLSETPLARAAASTRWRLVARGFLDDDLRFFFDLARLAALAASFALRALSLLIVMVGCRSGERGREGGGKPTRAERETC